MWPAQHAGTWWSFIAVTSRVYPLRGYLSRRMRATVRLMAFLLLVLCGCSSTGDAVGRGPLYKRKLLPGWHVELGRRPREVPPRPTRDGDHSTMASLLPSPEPLPPPTLLPGPGNASSPAMPALAAPQRPAQERISREETSTTTRPPRTVNHPVEEGGDVRRWNFMAMVSGIFLTLSALVLALGGGGIVFYLLTFSLLTGIIGLGLCIKHKERGKGIALAAIVGPMVVLALAIAALYAVW